MGEAEIRSMNQQKILTPRKLNMSRCKKPVEVVVTRSTKGIWSIAHRFEEDMEEKGVYPGYIPETVKDGFLSDPQGCIEGCGNDEELITNIEEHFDKCIDL